MRARTMATASLRLRTPLAASGTPLRSYVRTSLHRRRLGAPATVGPLLASDRYVRLGICPSANAAGNDGRLFRIAPDAARQPAEDPPGRQLLETGFEPLPIPG
jgi:hypothetical protein